MSRDRAVPDLGPPAGWCPTPVTVRSPAPEPVAPRLVDDRHRAHERARCRVASVRVASVLVLVAMVLGATVTEPSAGAGPYLPPVPRIVSLADGTGQAGQPSGLGDRIDVADDGDDIAFVSVDATLAPGDTNGRHDVYVKDVTTGDVTRVSVGVGDVQPDQHSSQPAMSGDARHVAFVTTATNLGIDDDDGVADVYVRDRVAGTTTLGSTGHGPGNGGAEPSLSDDGRYLAFSHAGRVYRRDGVAGTTVEVSVSSSEVPTDGSCGAPSISDDGSRVAFTCQAGATNLVLHDTNGAPDVFLRDVAAGSTLRASLSNAGQPLPAGGWGGQISGDGATVGFISSSPAIAGGVALGTEVYLRQLGSGTTVLGSRADHTTTTGGAPGVVQAFDLTDDGLGVVFQATPGSWQPFPVSAPTDVYTHDRTRGCTWLTSAAGRRGGDGASRAPSVSGANAAAVAWSSTGTDLASPDTNADVEDVFLVEQYCPPDVRFGDVAYDHPFFTEIDWMAMRNLTTGYGDGRFEPTRPVSRQAMASFLWRLEGSPAPSGPAPTFSDVPAEHPFRQAIWWMAGRQLTTGYGDGTFRPSDPVSRQAMASFLSELAGSPPDEAPAATFSDVPSGHPFSAAVGWMVSEGITDGYPDGTFRPTAPVSRQAVAAFLQRFDAATGTDS